MQFFYTTEDMAELDTRIHDLQQTLSDISARSTRLLVAMDTGLAVAGDVCD